MPLHDWNDDRSWDSVHQLWINSLLFWIQDRLPAGYRAYLGSVPGVSIAAQPGRPDLGVREWQAPHDEQSAETSGNLVEGPQPDFQALAVLPAEPLPAIHVFQHGRLVSAIELVSPRNKDRPASREFYRNRYLGYVWSGVHLMLVDVHRRPLGFSFVQALEAELQCQLATGPPPHAVSFNVGGATSEGKQFLDGWYRSLIVGKPLPTIPLALTPQKSLLIDLEQTYADAARRAYLE